MNYIVEIDKLASTSERFPVTRILNGDGAAVATLDVQSTAFGFRRLPNAVATDFLLIGAVVYALDKLSSRSATHNAWTRVFNLTIPVSDLSIWRDVTAELGRCVSFLTGDDWQFEFIQRERELFGRSSMAKLVPHVADIGAVSLFSGGMDSLAGVIDWFEAHPKEGLLLAGHHDKQMPGPFGDQENILPALRKAYPGRVRSTLVRIGNTGDSPEITLRGRSLVFIAAAVCIASGNGFEGPLILPENGTIALNVPLSPSRRGSCSTRTAHPYYVEQLQAVFAKVGLKYSIVNPLQNKTKGEVAATCANKALFAHLAIASVSCAKGDTSALGLIAVQEGVACVCLACIAVLRFTEPVWTPKCMVGTFVLAKWTSTIPRPLDRVTFERASPSFNVIRSMMRWLPCFWRMVHFVSIRWEIIPILSFVPFKRSANSSATKATPHSREWREYSIDPRYALPPRSISRSGQGC